MAENKMDAAVWRDLDAYQRAENHGLQTMRTHQAIQRKEVIELDKRQEIENHRKARAQVAEIRKYVQDAFDR